jgi:hypothetical protein
MLSLDLEAAPFRDLVLVCSKCAAKAGRGSRLKTELRGEIKTALKTRGVRKVRVLETGCLDICPKNGQTLAVGGLLAQGRLIVVPAKADGESVVDLLMNSTPPLVRPGARETADRLAD